MDERGPSKSQRKREHRELQLLAETLIALPEGRFRKLRLGERAREELEAARAMARGGSLTNAIVVDGDRVLNDEGLRHDNEFVRHKALDAIGDLYLAGHPIIAHFTRRCSSHADTARLMKQVYADRACWEMVDVWQDVPSVASWVERPSRVAFV